MEQTNLKKTADGTWEDEEKPFRIKMYRKNELARMYFPYAGKKTALQNLARWIKHCPDLVGELARVGYDKNRKFYLRTEVELIVKFLGEP